MNGELIESFKAQRGVRQGDPLSPYLFVLCMEKFRHIIATRVLKKDWKAISAARSGPLIWYLFFVDDLILFGEASTQQAMVEMKNSLDEFYELSEQKVNFEKSLLYIYANTKSELVDQIELIYGVTRSANTTSKLPQALCEELDKSSKRFMWGSSEKHHKTHLVKWDTVCLPKYLGGLDIKKASLMNQAMLSKASRRIVAGDSRF
ncbi:unnamed protein product [Prunus armeniaca]